MADEHLATYLNDHLAGSVVALELLDHLAATNSESELSAFFNSSMLMAPPIAMSSSV